MADLLVTPDTRADDLPLADGVVQTTVTSPPYWGQRDYGYPDQSGVEPVYLDYLDWWAGVAAELRRVTAPSGTAWVIVGDTYNTRAYIRGSAHQGGLGHDSPGIRSSWSDFVATGMVRYSARQPGLKDKDLMMLPARMAMIAQEVGWWVRCDVVWAKPWGTSEKAPDRPARNHETVLLLAREEKRTKSRRTPYIQKNRSVWSVAPRSEKSGPASFPDELVRICLEATSDEGDLVLDPFGGSGTTPRVALSMGRRAVAFDAAPKELLKEWAGGASDG